VGDDALETDTVSGLNLRIYRNAVSNVFDGLSVSPNYQGPEYVLYNTITGFTRSAFKYSYASSGHTFIYHNTIVGTVPGAPGIWPTGQYFNQHFLNNVFVCTNAPIAGDDGGESQTGNDFDNDLLWTTGPTLFRWKGINYATLTALRQATGFEVSGQAADPIFVAAGAGNFQLTPGSPAVDAGVLIPGINNGFSGRAPDLGAFEGQGADQVRPAPVRDLR